VKVARVVREKTRGSWQSRILQVQDYTARVKATKKYIFSNIFQEIITMFHELSVTVRMKAMALGHPFAEARRLANAIVLHVVLLCTLLGYRMVRTDADGRPERRAFPRACPSRDFFGLIPAFAGPAGPGSRAFLQA
jgi:hypothetical protein